MSPLSLQDEEFAIVVNVVDTDRIVRLKFFLFKVPSYIWWWLTDDIHVQGYGETNFYSYRLQIGTIDEWFYCNRTKRNFSYCSINLSISNSYSVMFFIMLIIIYIIL